MKKVLVVDNNDAILEVMEALLTEHHYHVLTATSYTTILPILYSEKPDMIILDVMLHNEDGRMVCQQIKSNPRTKDICIILFSASTVKLKDFEKYNADGILQKPFDMKDLLEVIHFCLDKPAIKR